MLMIFDSFTRCEAVMGALHAQQIEHFPLPVEDAQGAVVGHVLPYSYREKFIDTCLVVAKQSHGLPGWRAKLNAMIAAHPDVSAILVFHNELPANTREPPVTHINPGVDAIMHALGGEPLNDRDRAALGRAIQLRAHPALARSRAGRHAELQRVFGGGLQVSAPLSSVNPASIHQMLDQAFQERLRQEGEVAQMVVIEDGVALMPQDDDQGEDDDLQRALRDSLAEAQPDPPVRPLKRKWQEVLREPEPVKQGEPACVACSEHRASICILPCTHQVLCDHCARRWMETGGKCPVCKGECDDMIRPFLPGPANGE